MKIAIKKYVMDESLSWEERYKQLEAHHIEEVTFLIGAITELESRLSKLEKWYNNSARDINRAIASTRKYGGPK